MSFHDLLLNKLNKDGVVSKEEVEEMMKQTSTLYSDSSLYAVADDDLDEDVANEGFMFSTQDIEFNIQDWKKEFGKNILLVTGFSGSGKTTLSKYYEDEYGAKMFELDGLDFDYDSTKAGILDKIKKNPHFRAIIERRTQNVRSYFYTKEDYQAMIDIIISTMRKDPNTLYIIEGIQVYTFLTPEEVVKYPLVIKGTSAIKSILRRFKRNKKGVIKQLVSKDIIDILKWYRRDNLRINNLKIRVDEDIQNNKKLGVV